MLGCFQFRRGAQEMHPAGKFGQEKAFLNRLVAIAGDRYLLVAEKAASQVAQ